MHLNKIKKLSFVYIFIVLIFMFFLNNKANSNYESIYDFSIKSIDGDTIKLSKYRGKVILLVNVASYCGFTKQYTDLQNLWDKYKDRGLIVLGIPSRSFNQEKKTEKEVKEFCEVNFDINFPMTSITDVKGTNAHEIYKWAYKSYGFSAIPKWNFHKILINKKGKIEDTFLSVTNPLSKKLIKKIESIL